MTASDVLVETLIDWGVEVIFGLPGDGINGIMEALRTRQDKIRFVQVRHEEAAAFMACGYAKYTGKLGVCLATSGPGGIHLLNGLYDAKMDGQPVLAITGLQFHDLIGTYTQQDVALDRLFIDVATYNERIMGPTHVENVVDLAIRTALAYRTVSHVTFPVDFQEMEVKKRQASKRNIPHHTSKAEADGAMLADAADLDQAAEILNAGKKVAILAGRGALHASFELGAGCRHARRSHRESPAGQGVLFPTIARSLPEPSDCSALCPHKTQWRVATRSSWSGLLSRISSSCPNPAMPKAYRSNSIPNALACDSQ